MRALLFSIALIILSAIPALALDVLIVQSGNGPAYAESIHGFKETYRGSTQIILLSDYAEVDLVRLVKEEQPRIVLAVGDPALNKAKKIRQVPVVALMALSYNLPRPSAANIHGVSLLASPGRYLKLFSDMGAKRVGVVYDPDRTGNYMRRARQAAQSVGIKIVAFEVNDSREVVGTIEKLNGAVDALWMLPDTTAVTSATLEAYFVFSAKHQLPVIAFSEQYLPKGAAAAIDIDRRDMGRQAGEMANSLVKGNQAAEVDPRKTRVSTNDTLLRNLSKSIQKPE